MAQRKACCLVSEMLEETGFDRRKARALKRQVLEASSSSVAGSSSGWARSRRRRGRAAARARSPSSSADAS